MNVYFKFEAIKSHRVVQGSWHDDGRVQSGRRGSYRLFCAPRPVIRPRQQPLMRRARGFRARCSFLTETLRSGKLAQALMHGARVVPILGNFDKALPKLVREIAAKHPIAVVNSINPYRLQGQKTGAFEIIDVLNEAPDIHCIPVGNAANIAAYWMGYKEYKKAGKSSRLPKMWGFQASGAAPLVHDRVFEDPQTIATAIRIGDPASGTLARVARDESQGLF